MIKILDHFWLKIIALTLGLLLWFHVATDKIYNYQLSMPVTDVSLDANLALSQPPPESLMVIVSATGKQLLRQRWRERGLKIIATGLTPGRHQLKLTASNAFLASPSSNVSLDEITSPSSITLFVDRLSEKKARVLPDIISEPDEGFAVAEISLTDPSEVTVTGPISVVNRINEVYTQQKELKGLRNNLNLTLALKKPNGYGLELEPDSASFTVRVVPVKTRVFNDVPIVVYNSPPNQTILAQPASVRIELTGPPDEIDLLNINALIASADFSETNASGRTALKIDCPTKFRVKYSSVDSVTLASP
jgi:YbbR domain-containing protein